MKRKPSAPRNPFVAAAMFKKAGTHRKSNKSLRRADKMSLSGCSSKARACGFYPRGEGSIPSAPTSRGDKRMALTLRHPLVVSSIPQNPSKVHGRDC